MAFWWVNHKQTRNEEVQGGYLWSPVRKRNGHANATYDTMLEAKPGDVVFSYADGVIRDYGTVRDPAAPSPKPDEFGKKGDAWSTEGWLLAVDFHRMPSPLRPKQHLDEFVNLLPKKHSPIRDNGDGNQGVYLAEISDQLGNALLRIGRIPALENSGLWDVTGNLMRDLEEIDGDTNVPETEKLQLRKARMGQGLFRTRVLLQEPRCRVTGLSNSGFLRASHIKPWRDATSAERLDGSNGLMLAPHIDHLFDQFLISFSNDGEMLKSDALDGAVLDAWHITLPMNVGKFSARQSEYLRLHRERLAGKSTTEKVPETGLTQALLKRGARN